MGRKETITQFVREQLGCQCPEEVFRSIEINAHPESPLSEKWIIGGRLLIYILRKPPEEQEDSLFRSLVEKCREERDRKGLNRCRLVLASPDPDKEDEKLRPGFEKAVAADPEIYLHVVKGEYLP